MFLPAAGMNKAKAPCVEALTLQTFIGGRGAVGIVAQQRVADAGHVDPDLVGATGLQTAADMGIAPISGDDLPVGHGRLCVFTGDSHALSVRRMAAYGRVHRAAVLPEIAPDNGLIFAVKAVVGELSGQALVSKVVFCYDQKPGGVLVNTVDNTGALLPADTGERIPAVPQQGVHQCTVRMAGGGVDHHTPGFVDHHQIPILIDNIQRNVLGNQGKLFHFRQDDLKAVAGSAFVIFLHRTAVEGDNALLDEPLYRAAGEFLQIAREESVDPFAALLCCDFDKIIVHMIFI